MGGCAERWRAEIIVVVVLPISFVIWCYRTLTRWLFRPSAAKHGERVARVAAAVAEAAAEREGGAGGPQRLLRTDRSVFDSHSVRNSDKSRSSNIPMRDLRAILGLAADGRSVRVEPGVTVGEVTAWLLERELMLECTLEMADATLGVRRLLPCPCRDPL